MSEGAEVLRYLLRVVVQCSVGSAFILAGLVCGGIAFAHCVSVQVDDAVLIVFTRHVCLSARS